ncbi:HpcH/HpaI aldolase/citrate lyase family protein [Marinicaulis aureus]|uniref:HpcH/HpaI aldolase/citrate lyase family protein n=1 Tax=Hyphococcus aureus TaxID=2666033 RepID=A0ABW1KTZ4_9PROT
MTLFRSLLFTPADDKRRLAKAHERGADALILDLEDAVSPAAKDAARQLFPEEARRLDALGAPVMARINAEIDAAAADLEAVVCAPLRAIVIPKVESRKQIDSILPILSGAEKKAGLPPGEIGIIALLESPRALFNLQDIASAPRLAGLALGSEDFSLALGVTPSREALDLPCRMIALAAASADVAAYGLPISIGEFSDLAAYKRAAQEARAYGVTGALSIHPAQVEIVNDVFAPGEMELAQAKEIVSAWEVATAKGAAVIQHKGRMIDLPVVEQARRLLSRAR